MLCDPSNQIELDGATVCGQTLRAADEDSAYAVYRMPSSACGVTFEQGTRKPYLRLCPAIQIPEAARAGFERFVFECEDDRMVDLKLDEDDGEVTLVRNFAEQTPEAAERALAPLLAWLDGSAMPQVRDYVRRELAKGAESE